MAFVVICNACTVKPLNFAVIKLSSLHFNGFGALSSFVLLFPLSPGTEIRNLHNTEQTFLPLTPKPHAHSKINSFTVNNESQSAGQACRSAEK